MNRHLSLAMALASALLACGCQDPTSTGKDPDPVDTAQRQPSTAKSFKTFSFQELPYPCKIDESRSTVTVTVPYGTRVDSLTAEFTKTGISAQPASGGAMDFTKPVVYTLTSESKTNRS